MSCGKCSAAIQTRLSEADPFVLAEFDMEARIVDVDTSLQPQKVAAAIEAAGYVARIVD